MKELKKASPLLAAGGNGSPHPLPGDRLFELFVHGGQRLRDGAITQFCQVATRNGHLQYVVHPDRDGRVAAMEGKDMLIEIVSMLVGLIRSNSPNRDV